MWIESIGFFPMSHCATQNGDGLSSSPAGKSNHVDSEKRQTGGISWGRLSMLVKGHVARLPKLHHPRMRFQLLATVAVSILGLLLLLALTLSSSSDHRLPALLLSEGDLGSRIYGLCASRALTDIVGIKLKVVWKSDKLVPATKFSELFDVAAGGWDVTDDLYGQIETGDSWPSWRHVASQTLFSADGTCVGPLGPGAEIRWDLFPSWLRQLSIPNQLHVSSATAPCSLWGPAGHLDPCHVARAVRSCYQHLNPTAGVKSLLVGMDWGTLNTSVGILLQAGTPTDIPRPAPTCHVATADSASKDAVPTRRKLLEEGAGVEVQPGDVTSDVASDVAWGPRGWNLLDGDEWLSWRGQNGSQHWLWSLHWTKQSELMLNRMLKEKLRTPKMTFFLAGGPIQGVKEVAGKFHPDGQPDTLGYATRGLRDLCEGSQSDVNGVPTFAPHHVFALGSARIPLVVCMRHQLANLIALTHTSGLLHSYGSGAVDFVVARGGGSGGGKPFLVHEPVKDSAHIPALFEQKWTYYTYVDGKNGLRILTANYTQDQAITLITNPASFKFVFVRNPWSRMLSSYLDKAVRGGDQNDPWGWSDVFFGALKKELPMVERGDNKKHMSFPDFVGLIDEMTKEKRDEMEAHIALQADLCTMGDVAYDFVGHMEKLQDDSKRLMEALNMHTSMTLPDLGQHHSTNSDAKLLKHYNKELVGRVRETYGPDIHIPLNDIHHVPPEALQAMEQLG